jgi:hypothetical protein
MARMRSIGKGPRIGRMIARRSPQADRAWPWPAISAEPPDFVMRFSAPCRYWAAVPRHQQFFGGMIDAFDLLGVGEMGEPWATQAQLYSHWPHWHNDAAAFADDKKVLLCDSLRALSKKSDAAETHPDQQRLFEPDEAEVEP